MGSTITEIKNMLVVAGKPQNTKRSEVVRNDLTKILPKFKADFTNVEKVFLAVTSETDKFEDSQILAIARRVN